MFNVEECLPLDHVCVYCMLYPEQHIVQASRAARVCIDVCYFCCGVVTEVDGASAVYLLWLSVWKQPDVDRDRRRTGNQGLGNRDRGENIDFFDDF